MVLSPRVRVSLGVLTLLAVVGGALAVSPFVPRTASENRDVTASAPAVPANSAAPRGSAPSSASPSPSWAPSSPDVPAGAWVSWAYLNVETEDQRTGGAGTNLTASIIKPAIVADYLRIADKGGQDPDRATHDRMVAAIRDSDNAAAERLYRDRGQDAVVRRLIESCDLVDVEIVPGWWGRTRMSALDAARMGACLRDGGIVSPTWSAWVLEQMRGVRGDGRFGIVNARPRAGSQPTAIKNGWLELDGQWHVNCLAVGDWWSAAVLTRYPAERGRAYGERLCQQVADVVIPPDVNVPTPDPTGDPAPAGTFS